MKIRRLATVGGVAAIATGAVIIGTGGIAGAHTASVKGVAECNSGTYSVSYSVALANVPSGVKGTLTLVSTTPAGTAVTGLPKTGVVGNTTVTGITESGIPGTSHSAGITIHVAWSDAVAATVGTTLSLTGSCTVPTTTTTTTTVPPTTTSTTLPPTTTTTTPGVTTTTVHPDPTPTTTQPNNTLPVTGPPQQNLPGIQQNVPLMIKQLNNPDGSQNADG